MKKKNPTDTYFSIPEIYCEEKEKYIRNIDLTKAIVSDNILPKRDLLPVYLNIFEFYFFSVAYK